MVPILTVARPHRRRACPWARLRSRSRGSRRTGGRRAWRGSRGFRPSRSGNGRCSSATGRRGETGMSRSSDHVRIAEEICEFASPTVPSESGGAQISPALARAAGVLLRRASSGGKPCARSRRGAVKASASPDPPACHRAGGVPAEPLGLPAATRAAARAVAVDAPARTGVTAAAALAVVAGLAGRGRGEPEGQGGPDQKRGHEISPWKRVGKRTGIDAVAPPQFRHTP